MKKKQKRIKDKTINLFLIQDVNNLYIDEGGQFPRILCITQNKLQAKEYIERLLINKYFEHYKSWALLRGLDLNNTTNWKIYKKVVIKEIPYKYYKTKVNYSTIAGLLRIFYGCTPIGCSFDTYIEQTTAMFSKELSEELENKIKDKVNNEA